MRAKAEVYARAAELLEYLGPALGTASLLALCPELGRNEAATVLAAYRQACQEDHHAIVNALQWLRPGTVWAIDHTRPPGAVDGLFPYILLVRDLASHFQVGAMPQSRADDESVAAALTDLFVRHGAPLVLKSDNHGSFTGRAVRRVLEKWGVLPLVSPPYLPRYNGAVEAGAGQFKQRAHDLATRRNHPDRWTADDVEGARIMANLTLRPWGAEGPTPEEKWKKRRRVAWRTRGEMKKDFEVRMRYYEHNPTDAYPGNEEGGAVFRVAAGGADGGGWDSKEEQAGHRTRGTLPRWARVWNASPSPGHKRPWEWWLAEDPAARAETAPTERAKGEPDDPDTGTNPSASVGRTPDRQATPTLAGTSRGSPSTGNPSGTIGQGRRSAVYYKRQERRSLTDVMVARGLLVIRKRRISLPIKRVMRLKIS